MVAEFVSPEQFKKAPVGTPFMEACGECGQETGAICLKKRGPVKDKGVPSCFMPRFLINPDARCEFCEFVAVFVTSAEVPEDERNDFFGAAKIVREDKNGVQELIAFVPFNYKEDRTKSLIDGTEFKFSHGTVILAEKREEENWVLTKVLKRGKDQMLVERSLKARGLLIDFEQSSFEDFPCEE